MHGAHEFLKALALVLGTAAVTTVLFQKLRQPVVLGYLLAGFLVGPHVAFPIYADPAVVQTLSELGVILLMFALGLEFRLRKLVELAPTAGVAALIQCALMTWLGFVLARAFGWSTLQSLFTGALLAISSTTIIAKAFDEQGVSGKLRQLVVGILIVEDLIAVLMMAALTALATGSGLSASELAYTTGRLLAFLVGLVAIGLLLVPRAMRAIVALRRPETTLVASVGLSFGVALLAQEFGYSVALGAFIAGSLVAESGVEKTVERLVEPVKDVFAAIFFVSVGMLIDPELVARDLAPIAVLTVAVLLGKIASVALGAFVTGQGIRLSVQAGMSLAQIGEFSFIIAGLGVALGAAEPALYAVAVAVSALTTLSTPFLIRGAGPFASFIDRSLPKPLQTFVALYGSWIERLRRAPPPRTEGSRARRLGLLLAVDVALVLAAMIGAARALPRVAPPVAELLGVRTESAEIWVALGALVLVSPFLFGIVGIARRLGGLLAIRAFPGRHANELDLSAAPRSALRTSLELALVLAAGLPVLMVMQPLFGSVATSLGALVFVASLAVAFWRTAANLDGHVRAGAQMIVEVLAAQSASAQPKSAEQTLGEIDQMLPGLGRLMPVRLEADSSAVGRTLAELDLRGLTGATVLALHRDGSDLSVPSAREVLREGDVLALAGSEEAVDAARRALAERARAAEPNRSG